MIVPRPHARQPANPGVDLWQRMGGSAGIAILAHLGIHLDNVARAPSSGHGHAPLVLFTVAVCAFAVALAVLDPALRRPAPTA